MTGAQDCHGEMSKMGSNGLLKEMDEGDEGEAILSSRGFVALIYDMCLAHEVVAED